MTIATYNSVDRIIRMAMFDAGQLEEGEDPNPDQSGNNMQRLNDLINAWQVEGCKLFLIQDITIPLTLNNNIYTLGPGGSVNMTKPVRVEDAYYNDLGGGRRNIFPVARADWDNLPPAQSNSTVTQFLEERTATLLRLYLWNKPSATEILGQFHAVVRVQGPQYLAVSETVQFPPEWYMALRWGLAADICTGQPDVVVQRCMAQAQMYKTILENFDVELGGIQFQPDFQGGGGFTSRFS